MARLAFEKEPPGSFAAKNIEDIKIGDPEGIGAEWARQGRLHQVMWA